MISSDRPPARTAESICLNDRLMAEPPASAFTPTDDSADANATPVPWDRLFVASDKNKVEWYVVECERHFDDPNGAVKPSFQFLRSKGRC